LTNPTQAGPSWSLFDAQSNITRIQGATRATYQLAQDQSLTGMFYGRSLEYELPEPGIFITGLRYEEGGSLRYTNQKKLSGLNNILDIGADLENETELRQDHNNLFGVPGTTFQRHEHRRALDQSYHAFDQLQLNRKLMVSAGLNYSGVSVRFLNYLAGGLITGPAFSQVSYQAGVTYHLSARISTYGNVSTGFEPPTVTELGRDPNGGVGLNLGLKPQTSLSGEAGAMVRIFDKVHLDVAAFRAKVKNEIAPTGIGGNQTAYTNAAEVIHNGGELGLQAALPRGFQARIAYTLSDFYYTYYLNQLGNFSGHRFPGIPGNRVYGQLRYTHRSGLYAAWTTSYVDRYYVNDANTARNDFYVVSGCRAGYAKQIQERLRISLLLGVDNIFNRNYVAYNVINDSGGAFYYPSPPRFYTGSVSVLWRVGSLRK
jgi:iron complex outermembrane receptor protein